MCRMETRKPYADVRIPPRGFLAAMRGYMVGRHRCFSARVVSSANTFAQTLGILSRSHGCRALARRVLWELPQASLDIAAPGDIRRTPRADAVLTVTPPWA